MLNQRLPQVVIIVFYGIRARHYHHVQPAKQRLVTAKALSDNALDPVARYGARRVAFGNDHAQTGLPFAVWPGQNHECAVYMAALRLENSLERTAGVQPVNSGETPPV
jgi:hypothetical protein